MNFRDLPPEMQSRILEVCSPSDLAVLSRVDALGRDMAEYALYSRIQYCVRPSELIIGSLREWELKEDGSLLHTLVNNPRKALMVKMFFVELHDEYDEEDAFHLVCSMKVDFILVKVAEALAKTSNLVDLRILHGQWMDDFDVTAFKGIQRISEVIRGNNFKLHTLYLRYNHYLSGIVTDQPHLRVLGMLSERRLPRIDELYQGLSRCRTMPTVLSLSHWLWPTITMFPAFHRPDEALGACRDISTSLTNWHHGGHLGEEYCLSIDLLGTLEKNISSLSKLMEAMATYLQDYCPRGAHFSVVIHEKSIQMPWRFPEFVKPLALFEGATILDLVYPETDFARCLQMATDLEFCMEKLGRAWPSLQQIRFSHTAEAPILLMNRESNWKVIECPSEQEEWE